MQRRGTPAPSVFFFMLPPEKLESMEELPLALGYVVRTLPPRLPPAVGKPTADGMINCRPMRKLQRMEKEEEEEEKEMVCS